MKKVIKALATRYSPFVIAALQEVPRWGLFKSQYLSVRSAIDSGCAIVLPNRLVKLIHLEQHEKYWCLVLVANLIVVSVHVLDYDHNNSSYS